MIKFSIYYHVSKKIYLSRSIIPHFKITDIQMDTDGYCDLDTETGDGLGVIEFLAPLNIRKWRIEIEFDSPVTSIQASLGVNEQCVPDENKCIFENDEWNGKMKEHDLFRMGFTAIFDRNNSPPKIEKVVFQGYTYGFNNGWSLFGTVCGKED